MAFVKESIPQAFRDSFDPARLFAPFTLSRWRSDTWTYDKERDVAWIPVITDSNVAADERRPARTWYTMILEGHVIGVLAEDGGEELQGEDPRTHRGYEMHTLENASFLVPDALRGREQEIVRLAEEAVYVAIDGPDLPWIKGTKIKGIRFGRLSGAHRE